MHVIGIQNMNGRDYKSFFPRVLKPMTVDEALSGVARWDWKAHTKQFHGTLIKNERAVGDERAIEFVRYTVRCDDGKIRRFQILRPEA